MDLVKKKTIALTPEVHADLMRVVANIQAKNGVNTTANDAVRALLDGWKELGLLSEREGLRFGHTELLYVESDFLDKHFR
mgnify:FL=1